MEKNQIHRNVREHYGNIAKGSPSCSGCGPSEIPTLTSCCSPSSVSSPSSCCSGPTDTEISKLISKKIGYSEEEMGQVPEGANLGLGCGNPVALASLKEGEVVLDLGSGAGFDCFLAVARVGEKGKVIGVDMTPEMLDKARENAQKGGYENIEFRLGEIENLPVADNYVDIIISNCVINLSEDKQRVFDEAFRVLKPGGRLMVSDIVLMKELPDKVRDSVSAYVECVSGALPKESYLGAISKSGFKEVKVVEESSFPLDCFVNNPSDDSFADEFIVTPQQAKDLRDTIFSVKVSAIKPA